MDALGAAGHGECVQPGLGKEVADAQGHLRRGVEIHVLAGVQVDDDAPCAPGLGVLEGPLRHVQFEGGLLREPRQRRGGVEHRVANGARGMLDGDPRYPVGRVLGEILLEERLVVCAIGPALAGDRPAAGVCHEQRRDGQVVLQHLGLGGAGGLVEHLVGMGEAHGLPVDLHRFLLPLASHGPTLASASDAGDRHRSYTGVLSAGIFLGGRGTNRDTRSTTRA